ncbi:MAG: nitroreductase family deazaflavin-dependent oxidoreductase [Microlunatus sp.]|nr:nitroreductase family deazaflavin-dependent oxidoreductase [Microlunatus sp.]
MRRRWLWLLKNTLNRLTTRIAYSGRGPFSLVRHVGRRSGKLYETPIMVARVPEGFIAELTYGDQVNWYRNVVAAGGCELLVGGKPYQIVAIEPYDAESGRRAFGYPARLILQLTRRHEFRLLRTS